MSGKEAIIEKIISEANSISAKNILDAKERAEEIINEAILTIEQNSNSATAKASKDTIEVASRRKSVADLEVRKYILLLKQQLIADAFLEAQNKMLKLSDSAYLDFIEKLLKSYAEAGETVTISKNDKGRITQEFIDKTVKKLKLNTKYGEFKGGLILSKAGYDKNLTLEVLLQVIREDIEPAVATSLFEVK